MRVLINAASAHMGGSVTYIRNVLRWLPTVAPDSEFIVYLPAATLERLGDLALAPQVRLVAYPYARTSGVQRIYFDQVEVPRLLHALDAGVLFSSTGFGTLYSPRPQVLLVRNLAYFDQVFHQKYRELGRSLRKNTLRRWHSLLSIRRSDLVLFPTSAMRDIVGTYLDLDRIDTRSIHYGFDHEAFSRHGDRDEVLADRIAGWKQEGYRLMLNVSTFAVQKNLDTLVEALPLLAGRGVKAMLLTTLSRDVTTDRAEYDAMLARIEALGVGERVTHLGYIPYQQLGQLYEAADAYIFPSFTESFGHSMVEAMSSGLPVVAADTPVNREVCGGAASYFDTFDPASCASALETALTAADTDVRRAASLQRARHFSWHGYTEALVEAFRAASTTANTVRAV